MINCKKLAAAIFLAAVGVGSQAATVKCPGNLGFDGSITVTRQIEMSGALSGGECYYKDGNFQGDDVSAYLGSYDFLAKNGVNQPGFGYGLTFTGSKSGTWSIGSSSIWDDYAEVFIGFHFGNGSGDPDSFIVELQPNVTSGTWALIPTNLANGLSNSYLFGRGVGGGGGGGGSVPEPATLALVGAALLGVVATRRRRR